MHTLFTDAGAGSDANPIGGSYSTWSDVTALQRASNSIKGTGAAAAGGSINSVGSLVDCWMQVRLTKASIGAGGGPMLRCSQGTGSTIQGVGVQVYPASSLELFNYSGAGSYSGVTTVSYTYAQNDVLRLELIGNSTRAYINGTLKAYWNTYLGYSSGVPGLFAWTGSSNEYDTITAGDYTSAEGSTSITLDTKKVGTVVTSSATITESYTAAAGAAIVVGIAVGALTAINSVTYNGNAMSVVADDNDGGLVRLAVYAGTGLGTGGSANLVVTFASAVSSAVVQINSWNGVASIRTGYAFKSTWTGGTAGGVYAIVPNSVAGDVVVNHVLNYDSTLTSGSKTLLDLSYSTLGSQYSVASGADTIFDWTADSTCTSIAVALVPAAGTVKTMLGVPIASIKTIMGIAKANLKKWGNEPL